MYLAIDIREKQHFHNLFQSLQMSKQQKRSADVVSINKPIEIPPSNKDCTAPSTPPRQSSTTSDTLPPDTPIQQRKEDPDSIYDNFLYAKDAGVVEDKVNKITGQPVKLFKIIFKNHRKQLLKLEVWGDNVLTIAPFFERSVNEMKHRLFLIKNTDDLPANDVNHLIWKPTDPQSNYDKEFTTIFKLASKGTGPGERRLTSKAIPELVVWDPLLKLDNGEPVPHPETWWDEPPPLIFEDLFSIASIDKRQLKKIKTQEQ